MIRLECPHCHKDVSVPESVPGKATPCPLCRTPFQVPSMARHASTASAIRPRRIATAALPRASHALVASNPGLQERGGLGPLDLLLTVAAMLATLCFLLGLGLMAASRPAASWFFLLAGLFICGGLAAAYIRVVIAKAEAIRLGKREVDLFFGLVKLVLWEQNEGLLFLKNKRVKGIVFGPDDGGGTSIIFPFLGDELKLHLPLTLQMCWFEDHDVVTRESIRLFMKLAIWWRVKDKQGIGD